jgi:hypothetical protein
MSEKKPLEITPAIMVLGGVEHTVPALGDRPEQTVKIRLLPVAAYPALFRVIDDEYALADFITGQPTGWASSLPPDDVMEIADIADALNFRSACRWAERRARIEGAAVNQRMTPELVEKIALTLASSVTAQPSPLAESRPKA